MGGKHTRPIRARKFAVLTALVAVFALSLSALAAVTFDPEAGEGFVGKGDVQELFGFNNKQMNDNAASVKFRYVESETVKWVCVDADPDNPPNPASQTRTSTQGINGDVDYEKRKNGGNGNLTGFTLTGYDGDPVITTEGEHEYPACTPNRTHDPDQDETTSLGGGLQVSIDGSTWHPIGSVPEDESLNAFQLECLAQGGTNEDPIDLDWRIDYFCTGFDWVNLADPRYQPLQNTCFGMEGFAGSTASADGGFFRCGILSS